MKCRLLRDARIHHSAGEIVEVSQAEYDFLTSTRSAEPVKEEPAPEKKTTRKKAEK